MPDAPVDWAHDRVEVLPVRGMPEIRPGDDLVAAIAEHAPPLADGDVLVVTSKIVSKAEGRLLPAGADREAARLAAIEAESVRTVARRGTLQIVQTHHGLVLAAAGVDASNVASDEIALLPLEPDTSAQALRDGLRERTGADVAVIVSDSMGRPWRAGIVDNAIGVAGVSALLDARGQHDRFGGELVVTEVALADEIAAAADLVKGKLAHVPVAIVRGLAPLRDDGRGARPLLRGADTDMFRLGTAEALELGRASAQEALGAPSPLHVSATATVTGFVPTHDHEEQLSAREATLGFLAARPDAVFRSCVPGHLTASTVVVDATLRRTLLLLHPRVGKWLQPGGHCEPSDASLLEAARREAREETGIAGLRFEPQPIDLHCHPVTCSLGVPTRHYDVRFVAVAPDGAEPVLSEESLDLRWFDVDALPDGVTAELPAVLRGVRAALA